MLLFVTIYFTLFWSTFLSLIGHDGKCIKLEFYMDCQNCVIADGCFCVVHQDLGLIQNAAVPVSSLHPCLLSIWRRPRSPPASLRAPSPPCPGSPSALYPRESGEKTGTLALPRVLPVAPPHPPSPFIRLPSNSSLFSTYSSEAFYLSPIIGLCVHIK